MAIQATTAIKMTKATMKRLKGFDYKRPYFYMVTLKRRKGLRPFCEITKVKEPPKDAKGRPRYLIANELTEAFSRVISEFHTKWWGIWPIECFIIMPDHLHLLIHIKDTGDQMALGKYVYQLMKALAVEYWRLTGQGGCGRTGPATQHSHEWRWETPLRTQLDRRQVLVELDVIVTKALGLSLDDLLLMYRVSFPVLRKYEADTYYDQNGRCVFSVKSGESYLSRQEWESIKDMKEGEFKKTITETVFSDTPTERTITYKAPFFKKDREADYKEAWEMLEKRG